MLKTATLIIGAGPFGLSLAAYCQDAGLDYLMVGKSMELWRDKMPQDMYLRSTFDWHLDTNNKATFLAYMAENGINPNQTLPLSKDFYLAYVKWFEQKKNLNPINQYVTHLEKIDDLFHVRLEDGQEILTTNVVIALGFQYFAYIPQNLSYMIPTICSSHTIQLNDFETLKGKRCLIIGGRQSAFEWAALMREQGVSEIHLSHRHENPAAENADWSWVPNIVGRMVTDENWYHELDASEKQHYNQRLWNEGRLKIEPWLAPRLNHANVYTWPNTEVINCNQRDDGSLLLTLSNKQTLQIDYVIYATGYRPNIFNIPFLRNSAILKKIKLINNQPELDTHFQTNIDGLYITSLGATMQFGSFFGFTVSVRTSAQLIGQNLTRIRLNT